MCITYSSSVLRGQDKGYYWHKYLFHANPGGNHLRGVIREMLSSKDKWLEYSKEIHNIMLEKKELERERERELAVLQKINSGA